MRGLKKSDLTAQLEAMKNMLVIAAERVYGAEAKGRENLEGS